MQKKMLQYGKKLFEEKQLSATFVQEDILSYKSKKKYDIIMCQEVFSALWYQEPEQEVIERLMNHGIPCRKVATYHQRGKEINDF